jgi:hypothetical protein
MPNELQKWTPMEVKLAELRRCRLAQRQGATQQPAVSAEGKPGEVVDLLRICAVHDKPYMARYVRGAQGCFEYAQTIQVTELLYRGQYADRSNTASLGGSELAVEICAWCGASGRGSIRCGTCLAEICYGKVVRNYFLCRPSCDGKGEMKSTLRKHSGIRPGFGPDGERTT